MAKLQISIRTLLLIVAAVAILIAALIEINGRIEDLAANGYRVQAVGDLLVDYLEDCGKWPQNWDDLQSYVEANKSTFHYMPNIKDLQMHVRIKFDFDPDAIDLQSGWSDAKPAFVVVCSRYGRTSGATRNPNKFLYDYLRGDVPQSKLNANKKLHRRARSAVLTCVAFSLAAIQLPEKATIIGKSGSKISLNFFRPTSGLTSSRSLFSPTIFT